MVRIIGFHPVDPGSSPGYGVSFAVLTVLGRTMYIWRDEERIKLKCALHLEAVLKHVKCRIRP